MFQQSADNLFASPVDDFHWSAESYGPVESQQQTFEDEYSDMELMSAAEIVWACALPTLTDTLLHLLPVVLGALVLHVTTILFSARCSRYVHSLISAVVGNIVFSLFFGIHLWTVFIVYVAAIYVCVYALRVSHIHNFYKTLFVAAFGLLMLCLSLLTHLSYTQWMQIQGCLMILLMKAISFLHETGGGAVEYLGYIMHPATCVFGPWVDFGSYCSALTLRDRRFSGHHLCLLVRHAAACVTTFLFSVCWIPYLLQFAASNVWTHALQSALTFRFSHYFISHLSSTLLLLSGQTKAVWSQSVSDSVSICRIWRVEFSSSVSRVASNWNVPMHYWLKHYIYTPLSSFQQHPHPHRHIQFPTALLITYTFSALLHGLNFSLSAILLSLALFTHADQCLRRVWGRLLGHGACANTALRTLMLPLTSLHLVYLGAPLAHMHVQQSPLWRWTLLSWGRLGYFSHVLALLLVAVNCMLPGRV